MGNSYQVNNNSSAPRIPSVNRTFAKDTFTPSFKGNIETRLFETMFNKRQKIVLKDVAGLITPQTMKAVNNERQNPLYVAAWHGAEVSVIDRMLKKGANPNHQDRSGRTPLHIAVFMSSDDQQGYLNIAKRLLKVGAKMNVREKYGQTPIITAIEHGSLKAADMLMDKGAKLHVADDNGNGLLHFAAFKHLGGYTDAGTLEKPERERALIGFIKKLLNKAPDQINAKNKNGETPIVPAVYGSYNVLKFMIDNGANVKEANKFGQTPLHHAVGSLGHTDEVIRKIQLLLDNGADLHAKDKNGKTALYYASKARPELKEFLLGKGADASQIATPFKNLGDHAHAESPKKVSQEAIAANLHLLPPSEVSSDRRWTYWSVSTAKPLPYEKALKLNEEMGEDVRAFGFAGGMEGKQFDDWCKHHGNGVNSWHVNTEEGLAKLSDTLREHLNSKEK